MVDSEARSARGIEGETMGAGSENLKRRPVSKVADDADSFELDPKARLYLCLAAVAEGTVISYGALAAQAGVPRGARWAGRELRQLPQGSELPWHRVLRSDGFLGLPGTAGDRQRKALLAEGHRLTSTARGWRLVAPIAWSPYA
jgi:methylated-DNA-protein-cysteine methyltransferase-like protein